MDFRSDQVAAYVSVDYEYYSDLSVYYCTIDWYPIPSGLLSGYHGPFWSRQARWYLSHSPLRYIGSWYGDMGSLHFDYGSSCSREITVPRP